MSPTTKTKTPKPVPFDWNELQQFKAEKRFLDGYPPDTRTFFSPRDDVHGVLTSLIAISHLKICIVDGVYTVKGSTNWSLSGEQKQDNEMTISRNAVIAAETRALLDMNHDWMLKQMAKATADGKPTGQPAGKSATSSRRFKPKASGARSGR